MVRITDVLVEPHNTEKSVGMSGKVIFKVHPDADKELIAKAAKNKPAKKEAPQETVEESQAQE